MEFIEKLILLLNLFFVLDFLNYVFQISIIISYLYLNLKLYIYIFIILALLMITYFNL